jgi:hypothetical protein
MKKLVIGVVTTLGIAVGAGIAAGCHAFEPKEPKQREDWTASPMKYGDTQWEGIRAPGAGDAGVD